MKCGRCENGIAVIAGSMLVLSGCGIPNLRCAQSGPALPQSYNWNNGTTTMNPDSSLGKKEADPNGKDADAKEKDAASTEKDADSKTKAADSKDNGGDADDKSTDSDDNEKNTQDKETDTDSTSTRSKFGVDRVSFTGIVEVAKDVDLNRTDKVEEATDNAMDKADKSKEEDVGAKENADQRQDKDSDLKDKTDKPNDNGTDSKDYGSKTDETSGMDAGVASLENSSQLPLSQFFNDPYLLSLINQAFVGNQELRILAEEIQIACNEVLARSGEYRPFATLGAGVGLEKTGRHTRAGAVEEQLEVAPGRSFPDPLPDFLVATNVSWQVDIWKQLRNAQSAAAMRYLGTADGRNYIVTRLAAEVAEKYFELLALDNRMLTLDKTIEIQARSLEIAKAKKEAGRGTELAVQRFQAEVRKNESEKLIIAQEIVEIENRINFLVGRYPQPVERESVNYLDLNLQALSAGLPSQLLQRRADIRQAERELAAAGLDVKVARARFYPSLTLTGGLGWNAFSTAYLFKTPDSLIYGLAGGLVGPLINKRAIKAAYQSANAMQLQAIYNYQRTVLEAHIEVVNHMTKVDNYRKSIEAKKQQLAALEASVDVANKLFQNARAEYVEVLLAQREMMESRMVLIDTKKEQLVAIVSAYQALGGGGF